MIYPISYKCFYSHLTGGVYLYLVVSGIPVESLNTSHRNNYQVYSMKKIRKQHALPGHDTVTAMAIPERVGRGEQGESRLRG